MRNRRNSRNPGASIVSRPGTSEMSRFLTSRRDFQKSFARAYLLHAGSAANAVSRGAEYWTWRADEGGNLCWHLIVFITGYIMYHWYRIGFKKLIIVRLWLYETQYARQNVYLPILGRRAVLVCLPPVKLVTEQINFLNRTRAESFRKNSYYENNNNDSKSTAAAKTACIIIIIIFTHEIAYQKYSYVVRT